MNVAYSLINYLYIGDLTEKIVSVYKPKLLVDAGNYYCRSVFGYEYMSNIVQLQGMDASSTLFRYPVDKQVQFHYKEGKRFNINNVAKCFNELCVFLDCIDSMMADHRDFEAEMRADYMTDMEYEMY